MIPTVGMDELQRAAALMRNSPAMTLRNTRIVPYWLPDGSRLW